MARHRDTGIYKGRKRIGFYTAEGQWVCEDGETTLPSANEKQQKQIAKFADAFEEDFLQQNPGISMHYGIFHGIRMGMAMYYMEMKADGSLVRTESEVCTLFNKVGADLCRAINSGNA